MYDLACSVIPRGSLLLALVALVACGDVDEDVSETGTTAETGIPSDTGVDASDARETGPDLSTRDYPLASCDSLEPFRCSLPWPSNLYLAPDEDRATGYQLRFGEESLPENSRGDQLDPEPYRRLDGYGLGTPIMAHVPNVDTSEMATRFDIEPSVSPDAPVVLLEVGEEGGVERVPYWAELDARADDAPDKQLLIVRPAEILEEDTRYVVAFRNLETQDGSAIEPSEAFQKLRDGEVEPGSVLAKRQSRFEEVFELLDEAGVARESLTLAWDFRTASGDGLRGRMQKMRETSIEELGEEGPELDFASEDIQEYSKPGGDGETHEHIAVDISGSFDVPHFMKEVQDPRNWVFNLGANGEVEQNGMREAKFLMRVPHAAFEGEPAGVIVYGHGLFQDRTSLESGPWAELADEYNYVLIATDWTGMSGGDQQTAVAATTNIANFQGIADRIHQGILEFLMLARAAKHRIPQLEELTSRGASIDSEEVYYAGASQGGIYGQTFMALTETISRGFLAVPGNNYSTLLKRSVNFDRFLENMRNFYETSATRTLCLGAMQLLWTGTDPVSYATHIENEPIVSGPEDKDVLLAPSKGDYQVAVVTNEVLARSDAGIPLLEPYDEMHTPWGVPTVSYPQDESGIVLFDFGNPWPMRRNRPPLAEGDDPHDNLGQVDEAGQLIDTFYREEKIIDICGGGPCNF